MDEDQKEKDTAAKEEEEAGPPGSDEKEGKGGTDPLAAAGSAPNDADEPPAPKEEEKPSGKEDVAMDDAEEKKSANGGGGDDDGKKAEPVVEAKAKDDDDSKEVAASDGKPSRKKRAAPPKTPPPPAEAKGSDVGVSPEASGGGGREKRARKTIVAYAPDDFTKVDRSVQIHPGRGVKLGSIKAVRASVEASKDHALADLAHKIMFGGNKKPPKDAVKTNILEFSGYLPPKPEGVTEKELEAMDKKIEAKMGEKAFHLKVTEIRDLCDFFALERTKVNAKADLIDCLLDFLSEPSAEFVKGGKSSASKSSSKGKGGSGRKKKDDSSEESEEEEEEEEEQDEDSKPKKSKKTKAIDLLKVEKGEVPADDTLRAWVGCFVQCYDLEKASIKVALQVAGDKFGVDLADKKELLKEMLADAMG